jgi:hypothetical protein
MGDMLVRLDRTTIREMKKDARIVFADARHTHALEAIARALGADSFNELRDYARDFGAILWNLNDNKALRFLAMRGTSVQPGSVARIVARHAIDHEARAGFSEWSQSAGKVAG